MILNLKVICCCSFCIWSCTIWNCSDSKVEETLISCFSNIFTGGLTSWSRRMRFLQTSFILLTPVTWCWQPYSARSRCTNYIGWNWQQSRGFYAYTSKHAQSQHFTQQCKILLPEQGFSLSRCTTASGPTPTLWILWTRQVRRNLAYMSIGGKQST